MKTLFLPMLALTVAAFAVPAIAAADCSGHSKDRTAEQPQPEPLPAPST